MHGRRATAGSARRNCLLGCLAAVLIVGAACLIGLALGWNAFVKFGTASDLEEYHELVKGSDLDAQAKDRLMRRIRAIKARAREEPIGLLRWFDYDTSVRKLIEDKQIPPDELEQLEDELTQMEKAFGVQIKGRQPGTDAAAQP